MPTVMAWGARHHPRQVRRQQRDKPNGPDHRDHHGTDTGCRNKQEGALAGDVYAQGGCGGIIMGKQRQLPRAPDAYGEKRC